MVREAARALALAVWDKPASPCLASRIPYYSDVTASKLAQIDAAEAALKALGFTVCRVRHHGALARIEVPANDSARLASGEVWGRAVAAMRAAGFERAEIDPRGFKSGRMNDALVRPY